MKFGSIYNFKYKKKASKIRDRSPRIIYIQTVGELVMGINLNYIKDDLDKDLIVRLVANQVREEVILTDKEEEKLIDLDKKINDKQLAYAIIYNNRGMRKAISGLKKNKVQLLRMMMSAFRSYEKDFMIDVVKEEN